MTEGVVKGKDICRYCATKLNEGAVFCIGCERFQTLGRRLLGGLSVPALVALVPVLTLAFAFMNETVVFPYSKLSATVARCSMDDATLALSNTGTRDAIVDGGSATFVPKQADFNRALNPPGASYEPIVVKAGQAMVAKLAFADPKSFEELPAPVLPDDRKCTYKILLSVLEFGGRRDFVPAGDCSC